MMFCHSLFFVKQKTACEVRISDWRSDVCSSDLHGVRLVDPVGFAYLSRQVARQFGAARREARHIGERQLIEPRRVQRLFPAVGQSVARPHMPCLCHSRARLRTTSAAIRSEERRDGEERVRTCRNGWWREQKKKN